MFHEFAHYLDNHEFAHPLYNTNFFLGDNNLLVPCDCYAHAMVGCPRLCVVVKNGATLLFY